jgi:hypothetical protein
MSTDGGDVQRLSEQAIEACCSRVVEDLAAIVIEAAKATATTTPRELNCALNSQASLLARGIKKSEEVTLGLLTEANMAVVDALELSRTALAQLDTNSNVIRLHHAQLRTAISGESVEDASVKWKQAMSDQRQLASYASAAQKTGDAMWVKKGMQWLIDQTNGYFRGGGLERRIVKEEKRKFFEREGRRRPNRN